MADGMCFHSDTEHCLEGGAYPPSVCFLIGDEPRGGFDYLRPEPKEKSGDLFGKLSG